MTKKIAKLRFDKKIQNVMSVDQTKRIVNFKSYFNITKTF